MSQSDAPTRAVTGPHPYSELPDLAFWNRSVAGVAPFAVDPVAEVPFQISARDAVATAGSCFAQNIARSLHKKGFHYFVTETAPPELLPEAAHRANYRVFSARYGNIYTTRQLAQLFDRAYGEFTPELPAWRGRSGGYVDPFRPRIQPEGFVSEADLLADRIQHLGSVRRLFENLDVFVFTLGLTESWEHASGAVLPLAPGVAGGEWDPEQYAFRNYSVEEVERDLLGFIDRLRDVNPSCRIVLTVSPVPLAATYEARHVLVSTCLSKAVLRVAAAGCASKRPQVCYFPAFEIITGPHAGGRYFDDDLRSITKAGVDHVMRIFFSHFAGSGRSAIEQGELRHLEAELESVGEIICDEEALNS